MLCPLARRYPESYGPGALFLKAAARIASCPRSQTRQSLFCSHIQDKDVDEGCGQ